MSEPTDNPKARPTSLEKTAKAYLLSQIQKLAAAANVALSRETIAIYATELAALTPEQLDLAIGRTVREWDKPSQMPTLAFILARTGEDAKLLAEQAWELALKLVKRDWYADGIGWVADADKKLTPAMQYAIRQCGGEHKLAYADEDVFPFVRKDFLEAHQRFALEGGEQVRLTQGEAINLLGQLKAARAEETKALPEIPEGATPEEPTTIRRKPQSMTAEQHEARLAELRRQAEQLKGQP